jgi:hypothetical protein
MGVKKSGKGAFVACGRQMGIPSLANLAYSHRAGDW